VYVGQRRDNCIHMWVTKCTVTYICEFQREKLHKYVGCSGDSHVHTWVLWWNSHIRLYKTVHGQLQQRVIKSDIEAKALKERGSHPLRHNGEHIKY
jgi:hypothetical protein